MTRDHDLRLPDWGPYTKRYIGISHIADAERGLRFDLCVCPGFYRHRVDLPNVLWESGYHPWEATPDLSYYSHRHQLEWRDAVYCDVAFVQLDQASRLARIACVNQTDAPQTLVLHYLASLHFPPLRAYSPEPLQPVTVTVPDGTTWHDARDYTALTFATPRPTDTLTPDGLRRAEVRGHGFTGGGGIGAGFGAESGDAVAYHLAVPASLPNAALILRYRLAANTTNVLHLSGPGDHRLTLTGTGEFATALVPLGMVAAGEYRLQAVARQAAALELDGFTIVATTDVDAVRFVPVIWQPRPVVSAGPTPGSILLHYADLDQTYGLTWEGDEWELREYRGSDLDRLMRFTVHHHTTTTFVGEGDEHYTDLFVRPIVLAPGETRFLHALICVGSAADVTDRLARPPWAGRDPAEIVRDRHEPSAIPGSTPAGERYRFSQERLAATLLTNVVYPIYTRRSYIRHNTPGRWWDSLYTWDSGFVGLGLLELDQHRAIDCLLAYLTPPGDPDAAFLHHGSPVPVQAALFLELWNRTQDRGFLAWCYPRLRQYYRFLAGKEGSSTTATLRSGLLKTWDYFYNSGGWDDYPPQVEVHHQGLTATVTPVITTAQVIRFAITLRFAALALDHAADAAEYEADIARLSAALQSSAWDEDSGFFGYVCHDRHGEPTGILRHASGTNFNRGLDGAYPLVAGVCTAAQESRLLARLFAADGCWTAIGLTAVEQSAPYYRIDGYWNGTVWMAHQWFFWKALLDLGRPDLAWQIARTALDLWATEVSRTYNCWEHFLVASGRGAGWHHFGGLSAPVLNWFSAYFCPGRLTTGFDVWVEALTVAPDHGSLIATVRLATRPGHTPALIATLAPGRHYRVRWNDRALLHQEDRPGLLTCLLPAGAESGTLTILS